MEHFHDPQGEVFIGTADIRIVKTGLPSKRQAAELAAVEAVQPIHNENGVQMILPRKRDLVDNVGSFLRCSVYRVDKIAPGDILLQKDKIGMAAQILIDFHHTVYGHFRRGGEKSIQGAP